MSGAQSSTFNDVVKELNGQVTPQPSLMVCECHVRTKDLSFSHDNPTLGGVDPNDLPYP